MSKKDTMDSSFSATCKRSQMKCKVGLHWLLAKLDMASLQSSRTQCCCCTIGVFAAFFGIFMLSAGICIVLNVSYMDVDTSGLPPELHNDSGKKIVGIILICVSVCALGLSATVSIVYFALCNRRPRQAVTNAATAGTATEGTANAGNRAHTNPQNGRSQHSHQRNSDGNRHNSDSQQSLNSLPRQRRSSPAALTPATAATGLRKKAQKAKNHRKRQPRYHAGLAPTMEEPETQHSSRSVATPSSSQSNIGQGQASATTHIVDETQKASSSTTPSVSLSPLRSEKTPRIVINNSTADSSAYSTELNVPSMSFSDAHNVGESMTEESTLYDEVENEFQQNSSSMSEMETNLGSRDVTNPSHPNPTSNFSDHTSSQDEQTHPATPTINSSVNGVNQEDGVRIQPQNGSDSSNPQPEHPPSSRHHEMYADPNDNESDRQCESQSSFNSAFSNEGGDPNTEELQRMHDKMKELLQ